MTTASLVNVSTQPSTTKRTTFGLDIKVGDFNFNEWGLDETTAREANEELVANGDKPYSLETQVLREDGSMAVCIVTIGRKTANGIRNAIAARKAVRLASTK